MIKVRRALLSVSDKTGLIDFARGLVKAGVELISTGGTAAALAEAGLAVTPVSQITGFPEALGGRVKTLHPLIHGGILFRRDADDQVRQAEEIGIEPIDLVAVNLYPFEATVSRSGVTFAEAIEQVDIGGPAMLRSAAKNHAHVVALVDPPDYARVLEQVEKEGGVRDELAVELAAKAFARTCAYDAAISSWMAQAAGVALPADDRVGADTLLVRGRRHSVLRYGENPHQASAAYVVPGERGGVLQATAIQGKELSYNNIADLDAGWMLARDLAPPAAAIIKHANPCGVAEGKTAVEAFRAAHACDPVSAFGGVFAFNCELDEEAAAAMLEGFVECVIAPSYSQKALDLFAAKKNVRVMQGELPPRLRQGRELKRIVGGFLVQDWDDALLDPTSLVVTKRAPSVREMASLLFAWKVVRHVKSNAIVFAGPGRTLGIGAGQMSRVDSVEVSVSKARRAGLSLAGSGVASDAFFPFRDGVDSLAQAGATAIIQPGGSRRDEEVIAAADEHDIAMIFTGRRHFRH